MKKPLVLTLISTIIAAAFYFVLNTGPKYKDILVFGDSLSDTGNVLVQSENTFPLAPYHKGRFSNGPVWVEHLAQGLNLPLPLPYLSGGNNYAFGGARTGFGIRNGKPNVGEQVDLYIKDHPHTPPSTLVIIWAGGNDFIAGAPLQTIRNVCSHIKKLSKTGAKHFLVPNYPPLGFMPLFTHELPLIAEKHVLSAIDDQIHTYLKDSFGSTIGSMLFNFTPSVKNYIPCIMQEVANRVCNYMEDDPLDMSDLPTMAFNTANALSEMYNHHLQLSLEKLEKKLNIKIYHLDVYSQMMDMSTNFDFYGFKYLELPALDPKTHTLSAETVPNEHVFFDGIHPTSRVHKFIADSALALLSKKTYYPNPSN